ncbi:MULTISPECIES: GNAT family N-acetyltransferase [unclassified Streptomyces]|uniref:GNAT family N-acetyltransferase n=1 Tax=unclassified Streptomyces TaxID=2593676 RepID=UPI000939A6AF|nr:GNAT family N-acetyltransferase [Streptomyces sp. TSRI0107]OKJ80254.1 GCN5 family acetyltransferase [Streptomyces sp. TSRI0107]
MTAEQQHPGAAPLTLRTGGQDEALEKLLDDELTAFNGAACGAGAPKEFSVRVDDAAGEPVGGLTGWTWGGLCAVHLLWVREDVRGDGWGSRLMRAAEEEGVRRGCTDMVVSTYTFQAPEFYLRLGFRETGRTPGVPGGHADVSFHKVIGT